MSTLAAVARMAATLAFSAAVAGAQAAPNVAVNGSFEDGLAGWTTNGFVLEGYDFGIDDAAHTGSSAFYGGGIQSLGFLNQSLATTAGQAYFVDFQLASDGYLPNQVQVWADGEKLLDLQDVQLQPYTAVRTTFTARTPASYLQFAFRNDAGAFHLDAVSVTAVPEPAPAALFAVALVAAALRRWRQGRRGASR